MNNNDNYNNRVTLEVWMCSVMSDSLQPMDCSPPGQRILEQVSIFYSGTIIVIIEIELQLPHYLHYI